VAVVDLETSPPQPEEVVKAIAERLAEPPREADPWWRAGTDENLET
jgi:hypothetical protein